MKKLLLLLSLICMMLLAPLPAVALEQAGPHNHNGNSTMDYYWKGDMKGAMDIAIADIRDTPNPGAMPMPRRVDSKAKADVWIHYDRSLGTGARFAVRHNSGDGPDEIRVGPDFSPGRSGQKVIGHELNHTYEGDHKTPEECANITGGSVMCRAPYNSGKLSPYDEMQLRTLPNKWYGSGDFTKERQASFSPQAVSTWDWNTATANVVIRPGDDIDQKINNAPTGSIIKVFAGSYIASQEIRPAGGVKLRAEPGTYTLVAGKGHDVEPAVKITAGHRGDNILRSSPGLEVRGFEITGTNPPFSGGSCAGKGSAIAGGPGSDSELYEYNEIHTNAAVGISNAEGRVLRNEFFNNTTNLQFLGCNAGGVKGSHEFEAAFNYVHNENGNGIWCDNGCENVPSQVNGAWFHDNAIHTLGSAGIRAEELPDLNPSLPNPQNISVLIEDNTVGGGSQRTGRADIHVHDSANVTVRNNVVAVRSMIGVPSIPFPGNGVGLRASDSCRSDRPNLGDPRYGPVRFTNNDLNGADISVEESRYKQGNVLLVGNTEVRRLKLEGNATGCQ